MKNKKLIILLLLLSIGVVLLTIKEKDNNLGNPFLIQKAADGYNLTLYDKAGKEVYSCICPKEPWIKEVSEEILEVGISTGSPATYVFYFNRDTSEISDVYFNSILLENKYVVYMEDNGEFILTDIFKKGQLYKKIVRDFSKTINSTAAIINIEFLDDNHILLQYYKGSEMIEESEIIELTIQNESEPIEESLEIMSRVQMYDLYNFESDIEAKHKILKYNICASPKYDYENTLLKEYLANDIKQDKELCNKLPELIPLTIDYHLFDFNDDGLEDYLVCYTGGAWVGSAGNVVQIYIQESNGLLKKILDINMRLHNDSLSGKHHDFTVLDEKTNGYYALVLPDSHRILRYSVESERYEFQEGE